MVQKAQKVVIVGGVAGGASTAARLRRVDESAEIVMLEKGAVISYANCGLPYYIGDVITERENLFLQTPESMQQRFNIDVRVRHEVLGIDRERREISIRDLERGLNYRESYDKLVLAPGSIPIIPKIPGIDHSLVFMMRNVPDTDRIKQYLQENKAATAAVVGGGFIGLEMAENLAHLGIKVTLIEMADQVLGNLDFEMAAMVQRELRENGIELLLKTKLEVLEEAGAALTLLLSDGRKLQSDLVVMAVGVRPEVKLAREAGLQLGASGAIRVDRRLQTSDPNIFAIGDAVEVTEIMGDKPYWIPLAGPANRQGRLLADILAGRDASYAGLQGTAIVKVFQLAAGSTGFNERLLKQMGIEYQSSIIHANSHASYYPGALPLTIKLLFAPGSGRILGAQVAGYDGVDKRLDILATALRFEKTVYDLTELELAYAPPFGSAKDPVNIAGYAAVNILSGDVAVTTWDQLLAEGAKPLLLDVREPAEVMLGSIPGAINIPLNQLRRRMTELPHDQPIVVYCQIGLRAYLAARILAQHGFSNVTNLSGGFKTFEAARCEKEGFAALPPKLQAAALAEDDPQPARRRELIQLDTTGLQCPGPILKVYQRMQSMQAGEVLEAVASDPGFANDIEAWARRTGNTLMDLAKGEGRITARIRKGEGKAASGETAGEDKTLVVFSGDLDKAIAAFIIATGAASMGRRVTMFFTFWGLNILRRPERVRAKKGLIDRAFGMMMPRGSRRLQLSQMKMGGLGALMIRMVMGQKRIAALEELIGQARDLGIHMVACQMSLDVMGLKPEELIDGVTVGGVASYLAAAEESNVNLFI